MRHPRPYSTNYYRIVKVTLRDKIYHTVQLDDGPLFGPDKSILELKYSRLTLSNAIETRDILNKYSS